MTFGQYKYTNIEANKLVVLPQVRKIKNTKIDELVDSIQDKGLINPIDVAHLTFDELSQHIKFINQLWKKDIKIESLTSIDNHYYVVIAGHSRLIAIKTIGKNNNCECNVSIKLHPVHTSEEILAIQLDENIHSEPRIEERAIAIIETYRLGIINNKWNNKNEFIRQNKNKFSRRVLGDALVFSDLPVEIQEYVFANNIPFTVGVELGRAYPLIEKYERDFDESIETLSDNIKLHYARILIKLQQSKSIKRALSILTSHIKILNNHFRDKEEIQQEMLDWWNDGVNRQSEEHRKYLMSEYKKVSQALNSMPFNYFVELFSLDSNLTGIDHSTDIYNIQKLYTQYTRQRIQEDKQKEKIKTKNK